ncbi:MAG TPA: cytochrome c oxidase subunit II [Thermoanaerobaculia bacterium]|nr:cytochrome c oxidase subunit II [Thermoanaerobaculia bacterium]
MTGIFHPEKPPAGRGAWRAALLAAGLALLPAAGGALPFWLRLPEGVSSYSGKIDGIFRLILWITGIIFVVVEFLLLFFLFRYRHREGRRARYTHGNNRLEVIWTIIPAFICVVLALLSRRSWAEIKQQIPHDAMQVEIQAEQFAWNIRYPGPDGKFGTSDDIVTLNQLHFPVGRPVVATLRSKDVIHSFFLPEFRVKQDAVPGMSTRIWFDAMRVGHWEIACAELCGLGHYRMKGFVTVETPEEFEKWLAEQAAQNAPAAASAGQAAPAGQPVPAGQEGKQGS